MWSGDSKPKELGGSSHNGLVVLPAAFIAGPYNEKAPALHDHSGEARTSLPPLPGFGLQADSHVTKDKHQCYRVGDLDSGVDLQGWS